MSICCRSLCAVTLLGAAAPALGGTFYSGVSQFYAADHLHELAVDDQRGLLYATSRDGNLYRIDPYARTQLSTWTPGVELYGIDLTPDGQYALIAERTTGPTQGIIRQVDLDTGIRTNLFFDLAGQGRGAVDIVTLDNGTAVFSSTHQFSGAATQLREIDLSTFSIVPWEVDETVQLAERDSSLFRSRDGSTFFIAGGNTSAGPITIYNTQTGYSVQQGLGVPLNGISASLNDDGSLIAMEGSNVSFSVSHTSDLSLVETFPGASGGAGIAYAPGGEYMLSADFLNDEIRIHRSSDYALIDSFDLGFDAGGNQHDTMAISADGMHVYLITGAGIHVYELSQSVAVIDMPGDYNDDGQVTAADYTVWADTFGSTTDLRADGNGDGSITAADYTVWADNFGGGVPGAGVPEPASLALLAAGGLGPALRRRR